MSQESELSPGDRLTIGVSHQIKINGAEAWIKAEINTAVREGEDADQAFVRTQSALTTRIIGVIEAAAEPIVAAEKKGK